MRWFRLGEADLQATEQLVDWFTNQGYPELSRPRSHLMWWAGRGWQIRHGFDEGVVNRIWEVGISEPQLEVLFLLRWGDRTCRE